MWYLKKMWLDQEPGIEAELAGQWPLPIAVPGLRHPRVRRNTIATC